MDVARLAELLDELAKMGALWAGRPMKRVAGVRFTGRTLEVRYEDGSVSYVSAALLHTRQFVVRLPPP